MGSHEQLPRRRDPQGTREGSKKPVEKMEKPKHDEEHVEPTLIQATD